MPRTFGSSFIDELAKTVDKLSPAPKPLWGTAFRFGAPGGGDQYFSSGRTFTFDGQTYEGLIIEIGDLSSLTDRREPLRLDIGSLTLKLDNLPDPDSDARISNAFGADLESLIVDVFAVFDTGTFIGEQLFKGVIQAPVTYGFRTVDVTILSLAQKYLANQALRVLSDKDFPFIRSADNGKGVPYIIGNVRRAPGRVVKEKPWTNPVADLANTTGGTMSEVDLGINAISEDVTVTFTSSTAFDVVGNASGAMGSGTTAADFLFPALSTSPTRILKIPVSSWAGVQASGNVFTFSIDVSTISEITFSESPTATPISSLFQLYWGDYAIESGRSIEQLTQSGILTTRVGDTVDNSSTGDTSIDAPIVTTNTAEYGTTGFKAGDYEYVQTYVDSAGHESKPSGIASVHLTDPNVPIPKPSNAPAIELQATGGGVDKGTHRWAYTYVSLYGETEIGQDSQEFDVEHDFIPDPTVEPQITYEGAGALYLDGLQPPLTWAYSWVSQWGETKLSPPRSIQVLDIPAAFYGMRVGILIPTAPANAIGVKIYRTVAFGASGTVHQFDQSANLYLLPLTLIDLFPIKYGDNNPNNSSTVGYGLAPTENTTGGPGHVRLSSIAVGGPGTESKRIYRTVAPNNGPFLYIAQIDNDVTFYVDTHSDASILANTSHPLPADHRVASPITALDENLSGDEENMIVTARVELPHAPVVDPSPVTVKVYRSKQNKTGTHYYHSTHIAILKDDPADNLVFIDSTADEDLGDGLLQTERPPTGAFGEIEHLSGIAMKLQVTQPILVKSLGLMIGKVGNPTGDVQLSLVTDSSGQPTGNTIVSATITEQEIDVLGFVHRRTEQVEPTILPPGVGWFIVDTPNSDANNYYLVALGASIAPVGVRYAKSTTADRWIPQSGSIVFSIEGAEFTLDPNGVDHKGFPVAMATMDVEIPSGINVSCDAIGILDDDTGTYTGTPNALITIPSDVAHWTAVTMGKVPEASIDAAGTFATSRTAYTTIYRFNGVIQKQQTVQELLMGLGRESRSIPDWSFDKLEWKFLPTSNEVTVDDAYKTIFAADINMSSGEPEIKIERFGITDVVNWIDLRWARRAWLESGDGLYARISTDSDATSVDLYGKLTREDLFDFDFVTEEAMALVLLQFYLARYSSPNKQLITVTLVPTFLDVEKDDILVFDVTSGGFGAGGFGSGGFGGGASGPFADLIPEVPFQVEGKTIKADLKCEFVLREL